MTPEQEIRQREQLNEHFRRMRELLLQNETDQKRYEAALAELEEMLKHEARVKDLDRRREIAEKMRQIQEAFPNAPWFQREGLEFAAVEGRLEPGRAEVARAMAALWAAAQPHGLELDLTTRDVGARSIVPMSARSHKRLRGGEDIIFRLRSAVGGFLSVFNLGTSGETSLIYPNKWQTTGRMAPRAFLDIPDRSDYEFGKLPGAPYGIEVMRGFVTPEHVSSYIDIEFGAAGYAVWRGRRAVDVFHGLSSKLERLPRCTWAMGELSFEVVPA